MKLITKLFTLFLIISAFSCSSDDSNDGGNPQDQDQNSTTQLKLLKTIAIEANGQVGGAMNFSYNEGRVVETTTPSRKVIYTYENNKLVLEESFNYNGATAQYDIFHEQTTFNYENNILVSDKAVYDLNDENAFNNHSYTLDSEGKILNYGFFSTNAVNNQYPPSGSRDFTYSNNSVVTEVQTNGSQQVMSRIERTFDTNKNPFFDVDVQYTRQVWGLLLSPMSDANELTRKYYNDNNELYISRSYTYEYDSDGYPTKRTETDELTNQVEQVLIFEYY